MIKILSWDEKKAHMQTAYMEVQSFFNYNILENNRNQLEEKGISYYLFEGRTKPLVFSFFKDALGVSICFIGSNIEAKIYTPKMLIQYANFIGHDLSNPLDLFEKYLKNNNSHTVTFTPCTKAKSPFVQKVNDGYLIGVYKECCQHYKAFISNDELGDISDDDIEDFLEKNYPDENYFINKAKISKKEGELKPIPIPSFW